MPPDTGKKFVKTIHTDTYPAINPQQWNMAGRAVLITGASRGIGKTTAVSYAQAGASQIAIAARSADALEETQAAMYQAAERAGRPKPHILQLVTDVTGPQSVDESVTRIKDAFGKLDVLVNNAGHMENWKKIADSDVNEWWTTFTVNVKGSYVVARAMLPLLISSDDGLKIIINVASIGAHMVDAGGSGYLTTKLVLLRLTEFLDEEYADQGIISIAAHPGVIPTYISLRLPEVPGLFIADTPEMAADAMVWLSKERREWLGGRYVDCCWDMIELEEKKQEILDGNKLKVSLVL